MQPLWWWVIAGGLVGTLLRVWVQVWWNMSWPLGTFLVNLIGSGLAGFLWALYDSHPSKAILWLGLAGFCGGFTTLSALMLEVFRFHSTGEHSKAFGYLLATILGAYVFVWLGYKIGRVVVEA
jgi:fluoride exporter